MYLKNGAVTASVAMANLYFVSTVGGAPLSVIKQYIENQKNV